MKKTYNSLLVIALLFVVSASRAATPRQYIEAMIKDKHNQLAIAAYNGLSETLKNNARLQKKIKDINDGKLPAAGGGAVSLPTGKDSAEIMIQLFTKDAKDKDGKNADYGYQAVKKSNVNKDDLAKLVNGVN